MSSDLFIKYMSSIKVSQKMIDVANSFWPSLSTSSPPEYYLDLVVKITLHYIKA